MLGENALAVSSAWSRQGDSEKADTALTETFVLATVRRVDLRRFKSKNALPILRWQGKFGDPDATNAGAGRITSEPVIIRVYRLYAFNFCYGDNLLVELCFGTALIVVRL